MAEVWVVTTHSGWGEDSDVLGVFDSREAAWDGLKAELPPGHKIWVNQDGMLQAKPRDESATPGGTYAFGEPYEVRSRSTPCSQS
jgi:hypothetical protein